MSALWSHMEDCISGYISTTLQESRWKIRQYLCTASSGRTPIMSDRLSSSPSRTKARWAAHRSCWKGKHAWRGGQSVHLLNSNHTHEPKPTWRPEKDGEATVDLELEVQPVAAAGLAEGPMLCDFAAFAKLAHHHVQVTSLCPYAINASSW